MVKGIILDIDGVIIGEKIGFNSPSPHPVVIQALKKLRATGVSISLCTAKPYFAILDIIENVHLDNLHITEGGGVLIDPINNVVLKKHAIDSSVSSKLIEVFLENQMYVEFYTVDNYFVEESQISDITKKHNHVLQRPPTVVSSLVEKAKNVEIVKIMPIVNGEKDKQIVENLVKPFLNEITLSWGVHPVALPLQFGIITAYGISKENAAMEISDGIKVPLKDMLGVGDSTSDWQFMKLCGYGAAMGNASEELKELVTTKGKEFSFIGPTVDENGILPILDYFFK